MAESTWDSLLCRLLISPRWRNRKAPLPLLRAKLHEVVRAANALFLCAVCNPWSWATFDRVSHAIHNTWLSSMKWTCNNMLHCVDTGLQKSARNRRGKMYDRMFLAVLGCMLAYVFFCLFSTFLPLHSCFSYVGSVDFPSKLFIFPYSFFLIFSLFFSLFVSVSSRCLCCFVRLVLC